MKRILISALVLLSCGAAYADEGMWMVNAISRALAAKIEASGLQMKDGEIYNEEKVSLSDAIVALDFACSGSVVSDRGLVITNHHCAYSDVHALSTPDNNLLENGFWARSDAEEIYIPGKSIFFLTKVLDVTSEVEALVKAEKDAGRNAGSRRISYLIEKKYKGEKGTEVSLSSMWSGSRYYLAFYKVYTDIRLVAAPPVSIAAFGGDEDNWEWPQHKCDFAMYRIYAAPDGSPADHSAANVPLVPKRKLTVSTEGFKPGDFAMVLGYPGKTGRYVSAPRLKYMQDVELPVCNEVRGAHMEIMSRWMNADPAVRLKYSDRFFSLSNVQELQAGEVECFRRYNVYRQKQREGNLIRKEHKALLDTLEAKYARIADARRNLLYYRETMIRGSRIALIAVKMKNHAKDLKLGKEYAGLDMRLERDMFRYDLETYYENVDSVMWGPYQKELHDAYGKNYDALCDYLWTGEQLKEDDNIVRFFNDVSIRDFNQAVDKIQGTPNVTSLSGEYTRALYAERERRGIVQYPDANSTMRLTYGKVGAFRRNGKSLPYQTYSDEVLSKEDTTKYDFTLKPEWREMLRGQKIPVNFITDCDITGGNSGSAVLNSRGELIGLAFDGNKESLASDASFTKAYNKCVNVDIRYVIWTLRNYAHLDRILTEMGLQQ